MGNCTDCCDNTNGKSDIEIPYFKVCVLHDEGFMQIDENIYKQGIHKSDSNGTTDSNLNNDGIKPGQFCVEAPLDNQRVLLSVWTQYFFRSASPKWYDKPSYIKEQRSFMQKIDFLVICLSMDNENLFDCLDQDFVRCLSFALDEHVNEQEDFMTPIFLLGVKNDSDDYKINDDDFMNMAKRNDWGFGFCKNKETRDEEIKTFATIVKQIGVHPQLSLAKTPGEIVFSDSNSENNASIEQNTESNIFKKKSSINVGSKKGYISKKSNGSLIFGDTKHEVKLQKKSSRTDKYLSFHDDI